MLKDLKKIPNDMTQWEEWSCVYASEQDKPNKLVMLYATCHRKDHTVICYIPGACKLVQWECPTGLSFSSEILVPFVPLWIYSDWAQDKISDKKYDLIRLKTNGHGFYHIVPKYLRP